MRHTLDCPEVLERLPLFVGEDLEPDDHGAVQRHLELCAPCREQEGRARAARERFRGVLDESLKSCTRPGLWPELRSRLVEEGVLGSARTPASPRDSRAPQAHRSNDSRASDPRTETASAPLGSAGSARASLVVRGLRLLAPLAAAAAVIVALVVSSPFERRLDPAGAGDGATAMTEAPVVPVSTASAVTGGLRRVAAEERTLTQDAEPLMRGLQVQRPTRLSDTSLVHYR